LTVGFSCGLGVQQPSQTDNPIETKLGEGLELVRGNNGGGGKQGHLEKSILCWGLFILSGNLVSSQPRKAGMLGMLEKATV